MFSNVRGDGLGVGDALGEGDALGDGLAVGLGLGDGEAVAVGDGDGVGAGEIVIVSCAVPVPAELLAEIVAVKLPLSVGVPEIRPVDVFTARPGGRPDAP